MNIEEAAKAAGIFERVTPRGMEQWHADALRELERFAKIIRNQALEDAAKVCDGVDNYSNPMTASDCAAAIRAMKEQT